MGEWERERDAPLVIAFDCNVLCALRQGDAESLAHQHRLARKRHNRDVHAVHERCSH
jgi:hypothetical protein